MHVLITNDDGIYAEGIYALYKEIKKIAQVTVVAPDSERSSVGHGITLAHPIYFKKVNRKGKFFGYGISGTPADCVKFATGVILKTKPHILISGINSGANDGCSVFYSGTVAGAREGALMGIPSIAISRESFSDLDFTYAAKFGAKLVKFIYQNSIVPGTFLNVNVPSGKSSQIKGIKITSQGKEPIHGTFLKRVDPSKRPYYWMSGKLPTEERDLQVDTYALSQKFVTI